MIGFRGDYSEGAHESLLEALAATNREQTEVYGEDEYSDNAKALIKKKIKCDNCEIRFLVGGTQTNQVAIAHMLRPHQAVIATRLGHISTHETGAIEATGHKVIEVATQDGKLVEAHIHAVMQEHGNDYHMVQPKMVYISNATELGSIYTKAELQNLRKVCDHYGLYLYIDGARLAMALTAEGNDVELADYPKYADAFYIGGTKNGALFGEALVLVNPSFHEAINYTIKQRGALLAKGRLLGVQFEALFKENLYVELGRHANQMGQRLRVGFLAKGYSFLLASQTNQQFVIMANETVALLNKKFAFKIWSHEDKDHSIVRFVTSWATRQEEVDALLMALPQAD